MIPRQISRVYFAVGKDRIDGEDDDDQDGEEGESEEMLSQIEEGILDVFGNIYLNRHLIYNILELAVVRLVPELAESGVAELLADRGVVVERREPDDDGAGSG